MYAAEDYLALDVPETPWVIRGFLPIGGQSVLYGTAKKGKSYLALQFAAAVATAQREECGFGILTHGKVVYLQMDTARSEWHDRMTRMQSVGREFGQKVLFIADKVTPGVPYPFNIFRDWQWLQAELGKIDPVMVVVDTLRESFVGDENDSGTLQAVFSLFSKACGSAATLFLHHPKKPNQDGAIDLMNDMRGSSYIAGRVDGVMTITGTPSFLYKSRGWDETEVKAKRDEVGQWVLDKHERAVMDAILAVCEIPCKSERDRARLLAERFGGMTEDRARGLLRRFGLKGKEMEDGRTDS